MKRTTSLLVLLRILKILWSLVLFLGITMAIVVITIFPYTYIKIKRAG